MKPSKEEIEKAIGGNIPDDTEIEYSDKPPQDEDDTRFDLVVAIKDRFNVFRKLKAGKLIGFYIALCGFGFPIPSLYDISDHAVSYSIDVAGIAYEHLILDRTEDPDTWVVNLPDDAEIPASGTEIPFEELPPLSAVYPLSGSDFDVHGLT